MTNNELLDTILQSYLYDLYLKLSNIPWDKKRTFEFIAKKQDPGIEEWHIKFIKKQLLDDGFLEPAKINGPEPYNLTPIGIKAAKMGHYKQTERKLNIEEEISKQTIANLKRSKKSLIIAICALVISTSMSLISLLNNKHNKAIEDIIKLDLRIDQIENNLRQTNS